MKNQWIKFKHWLIKKLGGHVSLPVAPKIEYHYETPITLYAQFAVDSLALKQDTERAEAIAKQELARKIMLALLEKDLLDIVVTDDPMWFRTTYEARVRILRK